MAFTRASGVLLHPTSLPGPWGSGDFGREAYHFVDWLVSAGQTLWQVLPLAGLGPGNSPYMSNSAFAGNALLVDLDDLHQRGWLEADDLTAPSGAVAEQIDYAVVHPFRMHRLAKAATRFAHYGTPADREDYYAFCDQQSSWLDDFALFMSLCEFNDWKDWYGWEPGLAQRDSVALAQARRQHASRIHFWKFTQWRFFRQWARLKAYANQKGIRIIGDIPIFIAYLSAEVWAHQDLFELDARGRPTVVAGVPPDLFSATGQHWGNPLYRWSAHASENYAWWIERIRRSFELMDIVRIDHFRGFEAYWEIPASAPTAQTGRWVKGPGAALFEAIHAALGPMPIIAEDLGVITPEVDALRQRFGLPGMRILQFAFGGDPHNNYLPHRYERDAVVYGGTHDNDTTAGWWAQASDHERQFARMYLGTDGHDMPWTLIRAAMGSVADTAVHPMQDVLVLPSECRMNFPGQPSGWWKWRFQWSQVQPWHASRLAALTRVYGR